LREISDNNPRTKRYSVKCIGASMIIRPALVTEVSKLNSRILSVKYGSSRLFIEENFDNFKRVVEECKEYERVNKS